MNAVNTIQAKQSILIMASLTMSLLRNKLAFLTNRRYNVSMDTMHTEGHLNHLIKQAEKRYGTALGKVLSGGIGNTEAINRLAAINSDYNALVRLKEALTPKPQPENPASVPPAPIEHPAPEEDPNALPDGICNSESCEDEFCVEYWEEIENSENADN